MDADVGMWCRVKRAQGGRLVGGGNAGKTSKISASAGRAGESTAAVPGEQDGDEGGWKESEIQF